MSDILDIVSELPDEIWIMILNYVSLEDRIKSIQFVNKRFHSLCSDRTLVASLNFQDSIFMSERLCLQILRNAKTWIRKLSFYRCHWFSGSMFAKLPNLPVLRSLDLRRCSLTSVQLKSVLAKTPNVKNLAISSSLKDVEKLYEMKVQELNLQLDIFHMDVCDHANMMQLIILTHELFSLQNASSIVFEILEEQRPPVITCYPSPHATTWLMYTYVIDFVVLNNLGHICRMLSAANLHEDESGFATLNGVLNLERLTYLVLPQVRGIPYDTFRACHKGDVPSILPNLEYLNLDFKVYTLCKNCYGDVVSSLLFDCEYPKLRCLNIGFKSGEDYDEPGSIIPDAFYQNLSRCENLEELNLRGLSVNFNSLSTSIKNISKLRGLSISLPSETEVSDAENQSNETRNLDGSRISRALPIVKINDVFSLALKAFSNLRKLELVGHSNIVYDISSLQCLDELQNLQALCLLNLRLNKVHKLSSIFKNNCKLISLKLSHVGEGTLCEYQRILGDLLKSFSNLRELRLNHDSLIISKRLLDAICKCSRLEKLVLQSQCTLMEQSNFVVCCVKVLISACPRLHFLAFDIPGFYKSTYAQVNTYLKKLSKNGRKLMVFLRGDSNSRDNFSSFTWQRIMDFGQSVVANYNAYELIHYS